MPGLGQRIKPLSAGTQSPAHPGRFNICPSQHLPSLRRAILVFEGLTARAVKASLHLLDPPEKRRVEFFP